MRILSLDQNDPTDLAQATPAVTLERRPDGSVLAVWHNPTYRKHMQDPAPAVMGDDGEMIEMNTPELLYRYARRFYQRSQTMVVISDQTPEAVV